MKTILIAYCLANIAGLALGALHIWNRLRPARRSRQARPATPALHIVGHHGHPARLTRHHLAAILAAHARRETRADLGMRVATLVGIACIAFLLPAIATGLI
ncbi:MAG: hypothetical protein GAK30_01548 [Paracidovorax wautersii]|uniref:Uncharacterized protein n=1 Tax=Paracidovorax wautersii TaxID=1177982 RepID=A0A7V8FPN4_9BURK|nr:MAG: hypothetical protein GAK30_01548 [Paracidovorax wautersii]